ncbi:class I SAM-dependent methyltransferase [Fluoribacter dumoffii]|uniref:Methyltransferase type 11 domain-containing protein n=1 Tax=Fluoribacter dumoffii TaxID=463 RepID=A0A377G9N0_9GAMM|nr:methyltransferase domain-containing protein [Fluoribacter dumoffii]KTC90304.1 methyl-transferase [Fluoribacter dumoffii NY 23]MCW8385622.1 class I SAM-dependent methyltransferase [Fluoribacter dumoffii]MCW8418650.1 class I SAM-dependent methyltransferase [Fluoribacter dumoffii]MCW8453506.1 class I SAM-dependent methyltransferase [Fluoribacter dumoffii]MCW8459275.1 class I SAM-dependent methyltransferase [Fluoribacter dumoffii]
MLIERQLKQYRALNKWFQSPLGLFAAHEFLVNLESEGDYLFGETLLQLGNCGDNIWLKKFKYIHKWIASPFSLPNKVQIECALNHLPLDRNSVDCIIVPLTLEPFANSFSLLDEIDRVLKPMGFVIFLSINPWSFWGGALKIGLLHCYSDQKVKMRTPFTLNRILLQRGYKQYSLSNFCYIPPVNKPDLIKKFTFLDEIGKMLWPFPSGFYCYIAQKYQVIEPNLQLKPEESVKDYQTPLPATYFSSPSRNLYPSEKLKKDIIC